MTLSDAINLWIKKEGFCPTYANTIRNSFQNHMNQLVSANEVSQITSHQLKTVINSMEDKSLSPYTISIFCQLQCRFFRFLKTESIIESNPYQKDMNPKAVANHFRGYSQDEEERIRQAIDRIPLRDLYRFCLDTGIKGQFARAIRQEDVSTSKGCMAICACINGYPEERKLLEHLVIYKADESILESLKPLLNGKEYLFEGKDNHFISKSEVTRNNHMLSLLTGIPDVTLNHLAMHTSQKRRLSR